MEMAEWVEKHVEGDIVGGGEKIPAGNICRRYRLTATILPGD
jgi:hypothetical protein